MGALPLQVVVAVERPDASESGLREADERFCSIGALDERLVVSDRVAFVVFLCEVR